MTAKLSAEQIVKAEQMVQARMASDPQFSIKVRDGKIKFVVEPGEKLSQIKIVDITNPKNIEKYGGRDMFNTPQEAEHFTAGFGRQPTRSGDITDMARRLVIPHYQHQIHDPIRKYTRSPAADAATDITSGARLFTPWAEIAGLMPKALTKLPAGAPSVLTNIGLGLAANAMSDENLKETPLNIVSNAAAAGLSAAGNRYFSESAVKQRQLDKHMARRLGYQDVKDYIKQNPDVSKRAEIAAKEGIPYTLGEWRNIPLTDFDAEMPENLEVRIKPQPDVKMPFKAQYDPGYAKLPEQVGTKMIERGVKALGTNKFTPTPAAVGAKHREFKRAEKEKLEKLGKSDVATPMNQQLRDELYRQAAADKVNTYIETYPAELDKARANYLAKAEGSMITKPKTQISLTPNEWDEIARRFMQDAGLPNADPNDVIAYLKEAWDRPLSRYGAEFYGENKLPKKEWTHRKHGDNINPVAQELYKTTAYFEDPEVQAKYDAALTEYKERLKRMKTFGPNTKLLTPQQYSELGEYKLRTPFELGNQRFKLGARGAVRTGATLLPLAANFALPYVYKAVIGGKDE